MGVADVCFVPEPVIPPKAAGTVAMRTKLPLAKRSHRAALLPFADLHQGLHTNYTLPEVTSLIPRDAHTAAMIVRNGLGKARALAEDSYIFLQ